MSRLVEPADFGPIDVSTPNRLLVLMDPSGVCGARSPKEAGGVCGGVFVFEGTHLFGVLRETKGKPHRTRVPVFDTPM